MRPIAGMSVVVTGGGSGIGEGAARHLVARGARVTICGRRGEKIGKVAESLGPSCRAVRADITVAADREAVVEAAVEHAGTIDVLVNAAGNMYRADVEDLDEQRLLELYHSNVVGPTMMTRAALPHLTEQRGCVIFFGSTHVLFSSRGASPYAGTKAALETLTKALAADLGPAGVRVNCIRPGAVLTEINERAGLFTAEAARSRIETLGRQHALGRSGTVEEIAEAIEYLARAEWTTGSVMVVDGGRCVGIVGT